MKSVDPMAISVGTLHPSVTAFGASVSTITAFYESGRGHGEGKRQVNNKGQDSGFAGSDMGLRTWMRKINAHNC